VVLKLLLFYIFILFNVFCTRHWILKQIIPLAMRVAMELINWLYINQTTTD